MKFYTRNFWAAQGEYCLCRLLRSPDCLYKDTSNIAQLFPFEPLHRTMPLYEYECAKGHRFEAVEKVSDKTAAKCAVCSAKARSVISPPTLLHDRGLHVFTRVTKVDALRSRPSSLKSFKKDKF